MSSIDLRLEAPVATPEAYLLEAEDFQVWPSAARPPRLARGGWLQFLLALAVLLPLAAAAVVLI